MCRQSILKDPTFNIFLLIPWVVFQETRYHSDVFDISQPVPGFNTEKVSASNIPRPSHHDDRIYQAKSITRMYIISSGMCNSSEIKSFVDQWQAVIDVVCIPSIHISSLRNHSSVDVSALLHPNTTFQPLPYLEKSLHCQIYCGVVGK